MSTSFLPSYVRDINFDAICVAGNRLGSGVSREVFTFLPNPSVFVVKRMKESGLWGDHITANRNEFNFWNDYAHVVGQHLAPVAWISSDSRYLLMRRTLPISDHDDVTASLGGKSYKVLPWMADDHIGNYGWFGDRVVAHDYGFVQPYRIGEVLN